VFRSSMNWSFSAERARGAACLPGCAVRETGYERGCSRCGGLHTVSSSALTASSGCSRSLAPREAARAAAARRRRAPDGGIAASKGKILAGTLAGGDGLLPRFGSVKL
jgi:hypothetical protein